MARERLRKLLSSAMHNGPGGGNPFIMKTAS
jgi:hypothetical protein